MSKEKVNNIKKVNTEVEEDVLDKLKILAILSKVSLGIYVKQILDKHVASKNKQIEEAI